MLKKLLMIVTISLSSNILSAAVPSFTDADWERIPSPGELSVEEVMSLFAGSIEKNGREWSLMSFDNHDLRTVTADRQFEVKQLDEVDMFAHQPFSVDSVGQLRYELFLVSLTKTYPHNQDDDEDEDFSITARLPITTQLTAEELTNPIIRAVQSSITFEEEARLARENMREFERTIGIQNARNVLMFVLPEHREEFSSYLN